MRTNREIRKREEARGVAGPLGWAGGSKFQFTSGLISKSISIDATHRGQHCGNHIRRSQNRPPPYTQIDLIQGRFIPGNFRRGLVPHGIARLMLLLVAPTRVTSQTRSGWIIYLASAMEKATLISSLTFTAPPATFTGVIPKSDCFSTVDPVYSPPFNATSNEIGRV